MTNTNETPRQDVYSRITNQIIKALERGPRRRPRLPASPP